MKIIGLTGQARHGKNTAASIITEAWGRRRARPSTIMAFADPLKRECAEAFGVDPRMFYDDEQKDKPQQYLRLENCHLHEFVTLCLGDRFRVLLHEAQRPRFVAQTWGTELRRAQDPLYWVKKLQAELVDAKSRGFGLAVVTDVRFLNEAEMIKASGGVIWKVVRPGVGMLRSGGTHQSETEMESMRVDAILTNDSIERLRMAIVDNLEGI
jgi:hypothetical protein